MTRIALLLVMLFCLACLARSEDVPASHSVAGNRNRIIGLAYGTALTEGAYVITSWALPKSMSEYHRKGWASAAGFAVGMAGVLALSKYHRDVQPDWGPMYLESMQRPEYMMIATFSWTTFNFIWREFTSE